MEQDITMREEDLKGNLNKGKAVYAKIGWAYAIFGITTFLLQLCLQWFSGSIQNQEWFTWANIVVPNYIIGVPLVFLLVKNIEVSPMAQHKMKIGQFITCVAMISCICIIGSLIGTPINMGIVSIFGGDVANSNALGAIMLNSSAFPRILVVGFCAPFFEELLFRKFLIDRVVKYGEWIAIVASGLMFGLFHGNFAQFFFAAGLGMFFAYIYVRTGKIWYTMAFHAIVNLSSAAVMVTLYQKLDLTKIQQLSQMDMQSQEAQQLTMQYLPPMLLLLGWFGIILILSLVGFILLICFRKRFFIQKADNEMPREGRIKNGIFSPGMIAFYLICIGMFVYYYASIINM